MLTQCLYAVVKLKIADYLSDGEKSVSQIDAILNSYDFSQFDLCVDVGGGKGQLICSILDKHINTRGIFLDLPYLKESAENYIYKKFLDKRCHFQGGNFFEEVPDKGDAYLLRVILHDWSDGEVIKILQNCRNAMKPTAKLLIIEKVILPQTDLRTVFLGDINMLISLTGKERSLEEYNSLLKEGGFELIKVISTSTVFSIIKAMPAKNDSP